MELDINKVNKVMLDNGMFQKDLAEKSKIQESTLSKILNGKVSKPNRKTIHSIAKGLNVSPSEIVKEMNKDE